MPPQNRLYLICPFSKGKLSLKTYDLDNSHFYTDGCFDQCGGKNGRENRQKIVKLTPECQGLGLCPKDEVCLH